MIRKIIATCIVIAVLGMIVACGSNSESKTTGTTVETTQQTFVDGSDSPPQTNNSANATGTAQDLPVNRDIDVVFNNMEYVLWINIFYNNQGDDYVGEKVTKEGTFTTLADAYNNVTRYYVWGYNDQTKCCDWEWEIDPSNLSEVPQNGSKVSVTGVFDASESSLDGYWITDPEITVENEYAGSDYDIDTGCMGGTLEMVQLMNVLGFPERFAGKSVYAYGRINSQNSFIHPYYDGVFEIQFNSIDSIPGTGTESTITGVIGSDATIEQATVMALE